MYKRLVVLVVFAAMALTGCSSNGGKSTPVDLGTPSRPAVRISEHDKMIQYIESPARNKRLDDAFAAIAPAIVGNAFSGAFGTPITKLDGNKQPLEETYVGPGSIHVDSKKSGWKLDADVYWRYGSIDYFKGITYLHLDAGSNQGGVFLTRSGATSKTSSADAAFQAARSGRLTTIDYTGTATSNTSTLYVNTEKGAIELDNKVLYVLGYNSQLLPGGE